MMKKICSILILLVSLSLPVFSQIIDQTVATVRLTKVEVISQKKFREQIQLLEQQLRTQLSKEQKKQLLDNQINGILISQAAERDNISATDQEINQAVATQKAQIQQQYGTIISDSQFRILIENQANMSWSDYIDQLKKRVIQEKYIIEKKRSMFDNIPQPSEKEIKALYNETATRFTNPESVRFSHIYIDTRNLDNDEKIKARNRAEEIYRKIRSGSATFEKLAMDSSDDTASKYKDGDAGWLLRNDTQRKTVLGTSFFEAVFELPVGKASDVLESKVGYHIVKVTEKREPKLLKLNDPILPGQSTTVRDQIKNLLLMQKQEELFQQALEDIVKELKKEADITIFEENLDW
jgi:parvulin-like peptidyl-prolyl isomerase